MNVPFSIWCPSPASSGMEQSIAINNTINLCQEAEKLNYKRFWIAEHHSSRSFVGSAPEILMGVAASKTNKIKIGSAAILVPRYEVANVVEKAFTLESLFPNRIDIGIGRALGASTRASFATGQQKTDDPFAKHSQMLEFWDKGFVNTQERGKLRTYPLPETRPELWIMGASPNSAVYAGENGLPYCIGGFIDGRVIAPCIDTYRNHFKPSKYLDKPYIMAAVFVLAGDNVSELKSSITSAEMWYIRTMIRKTDLPIPASDENFYLSLDDHENMALDIRRKSVFTGLIDEVEVKLNNFIKQYKINEILQVTFTYSHEQRLKSYALIAQRFN